MCLVDPGCYRDIHNGVQQISGGKGQVDVLSLGVMAQGDAHSQFDAWGSSKAMQPAEQLQEAEKRLGPDGFCKTSQLQ